MLGYDIITDRINHRPTKLQSYATEIIPDENEFSEQKIEELAEFRKLNANLCFSTSEYCANLENASIAHNQNTATSLLNNSASENRRPMDNNDNERVIKVSRSVQEAHRRINDFCEHARVAGKFNEPDPANLADPRVVDYTVNERLFPVPVDNNYAFDYKSLAYSRSKPSQKPFNDDTTDIHPSSTTSSPMLLNIHPKLSSTLENIEHSNSTRTSTKNSSKNTSPQKSSLKKTQMSSSDTTTRYIRLNFPRHRIDPDHCSVVRNTKPKILARTKLDEPCSLSLLSNSKNSVKFCGQSFQKYKPKSNAPKNKQELDISHSKRENVYSKMRKVQSEAERVLEQSNQEIALRTENYNKKFADAREWLDRYRKDKEQAGQVAQVYQNDSFNEFSPEYKNRIFHASFPSNKVKHKTDSSYSADSIFD